MKEIKFRNILTKRTKKLTKCFMNCSDKDIKNELLIKIEEINKIIIQYDKLFK